MLRICATFVLILWSIPALAWAADSVFSGPVRVIDADTWDVGGERVRLFGIDAPEQDQICQKADGHRWACGQWASTQVRLRYSGQRARCTRVDTDRYGRTVARCTVNGRDVGRDVVTDGVALAYRRYSNDYVGDEKAAALAGRGMHAAQFQPPAEFRAAKGKAATEPPRSGNCMIKGNISKRGERIYHAPGQRYYSKTRISASRGERWFCSEDAARAAGWRRARI